MKTLRMLCLAAAVAAGAPLVTGAGCQSQAPAQSGSTTYKCAMESCTKTKDAKAGDAAPS